MLFNEPKLLKYVHLIYRLPRLALVSVLFNEPKLLKSSLKTLSAHTRRSFSALQRAEIAEIYLMRFTRLLRVGFSALQRAEIAEIS